MIDPANIVQIVPAQDKQYIKFGDIPDCDLEAYNLYDEKDFAKYINDVEKEVRKSFEYQRLIQYLRNYMGMNNCAFFDGITNSDNTKIRIEVHHYPFTLYDISLIVFNKRMFYKESLTLEDVANEVCRLHYQSMVGLISLGTTVHQLAHNNYIFIPIDKVFGRYKLFMESYKEFMLPEHIDILNRLEEYTKDYYERHRSNNVLLQSNVILEQTSELYKMPDLNTLTDKMFNRIQEIKDNGYRLPTLMDKQDMTKRISNVQKRNAIYFFNEEGVK